MVTSVLQNDSDVVTSTGSANVKHRSRGYFESRMNDIQTLILENEQHW